MEREWMAMLGAAGFIAIMLTSGYTMIYFERRKHRKRAERGTSSSTPPPARH